MKAKEYLENISYKKTLLDLKIEELKDLRETASDVSGMQITERVQTSPKGDGMINTLIKLETLDKKISDILDEITRDRDKAQEIISMMADDREREILHRKYLLNQNWSQIAYKMNYTERGTQKLNGRALQNFDKVFQKVFANVRDCSL